MKALSFLVVLMVVHSHLSAETRVFESGRAQTALLELFTSEGCSSCPPAESWLSELKVRPELWKDVVPVAFHVDYWDHLGWKDKFASPIFTARQHHYAAAWRGSSVYTPGFVLNGREWRGWSPRATVPPAGSSQPGKLKAVLDQAQVEIEFVPAGKTSGPLVAEIALLGGDLDSYVARGENSGRKLHHDFAALYLGSSALRSQEGRFSARVALPPDSLKLSQAIAVWVSAGEGGAVLQATGGWRTAR